MNQDKEIKNWEKRFDKAVSENYRGQDLYWPDWEGIKGFIRTELARQKSDLWKFK